MPQGRRLRALLLTVVLGSVALAAPVSAGAAPTVVSLTFDDGWDNQQTADSMLTAHGMVGTFYVNSQTIGQPGYLSWTQLTKFNANGSEIAGHTLTHPDLTTLTATQAQNEICQDRQNILAHGFVVPDFAYPFGAYDSTTGSGSLDVSSIVRACGYASGRGAFGLRNIVATNDTRPYATTIPPPNLYKIKTPCCVNHQQFGGSTPTAAALQDYVTHAETGGGGWVNFVIHRLCDNCGDDAPAPSMSPSEFDAFLDWLRPRAASGTVVRTVAQVVKNDTQAPSTSIACGGAACSTGWYGGPVSMTLSATETGTAGVAMIRYTTDGSEPTAASPAYTGPFTVSATTTVKYRAWDHANNVEPVKSQLVQVDATAPVSSISCNASACAGTDYEGPVTVALAATDGASGVDAIRYTLDGSEPTTTSPRYSTPFTVSETTTVRFRAWDAAGNVEDAHSQRIAVAPPPPQDTTAPTSAITCNGTACLAGWYTGPVSVALSATDDASGVEAIHYTLDGSTPTDTSPLYTGAFTVSQTTTVKFRASDNAGNVESTKSQLVQIDATAPVSSISCNGSACAGTAYVAPVTVALSATDGGSGVEAIRYTLDGSDPTTASPLYGEPFAVSETTTVRYRAWDASGNVEAVRSQLVEIVAPPPQDTIAPTSAIACNGTACSAWYAGPVSVKLSATDDASGVAAIRYTLDGSTPTASSQLYTGPFTVSQTTTVRYRAWDNAGNVEPANSQLVRIDTVAPTVAITAPANGATVKGVVKVTANAGDAGSGVATVSFYANGVLIGSKAGGGTVFVSWNTGKLKGQYTLTAVAKDVAGNSTTSAAVTVTAG